MRIYESRVNNGAVPNYFLQTTYQNKYENLLTYYHAVVDADDGFS